MNEKEILMEIGRNICAERNRARLSQEALAEKISMNVRNLGRIERGESNAKITILLSIMKVLNIPFEAIYKDTE